MQQQLKRLRKILTKEEFIEREFNKSKSVGSKSVVKSTLINFEEFCKKVYGMDSQIMLVELQKNLATMNQKSINARIYMPDVNEVEDQNET